MLIIEINVILHYLTFRNQLYWTTYMTRCSFCEMHSNQKVRVCLQDLISTSHFLRRVIKRCVSNIHKCNVAFPHFVLRTDQGWFPNSRIMLLISFFYITYIHDHVNCTSIKIRTDIIILAHNYSSTFTTRSELMFTSFQCIQVFEM